MKEFLERLGSHIDFAINYEAIMGMGCRDDGQDAAAKEDREENIESPKIEYMMLNLGLIHLFV